MTTQTDISNMDHIKDMVDSFYSKIRKDDLLGDIFNGVIGDRWDQHLDKMYKFWQTVLLRDHTYYGSPFSPHAKLPLEKHHFDRWKSIFYETIDERFSGEKANEAKWRAEKMAEMFLMKIEFYKKSNAKQLL